MIQAKAIRYFSVAETITRLVDMVGLLLAMYLSELLVENMVFGGAVYLLGAVWATYIRLYNQRAIRLLPRSTRGKGLFIFVLTALLTVALVFLFPYIQSKATALVLVVLTLGFVLQQIVTDAVARRLTAPLRGRLWRLAVIHAAFLASYAGFFAMNRWVVGYDVAPEVSLVYMAAIAAGVLLWVCQATDLPGPEDATPPDKGLDGETLMDVHAYRVYNKMAVNTMLAINLSITAFTCYMYFIPGNSFSKNVALLITWLLFISVVTVLCMVILRKRYLPRYDRPGIFLFGLAFWIIAAVRILTDHNAPLTDSLVNAALMGLSVGCMLSIILEQSLEMKGVIELGVGHIDGGAYVRNTNAMMDWSRLVSCLLLLVMLTVASFTMDGRVNELEARLGMQRVLRAGVVLLPLGFMLASLFFSMLQPLDRQYAIKLRAFMHQAGQGKANPQLEARLKKVLVSNYPRKLAVLVLKPIIRPFMPCRVRGAENVDLTNGPVIFVVNHLELYGPMIAVLHSPFFFRPWIINEMLQSDIIEAHMRTGVGNLFPRLPMKLRLRLIHIAAPVVRWIMQATDPIPVHRGTVRAVIGTINESVDAMQYDDNILLFPEINYQQEGVGDFFTGFVQVAKSYHRKTGKCATFYPVYISRKHRTMTYGQGVTFDPERGSGEEKERIVGDLQGQMNAMAAGKELTTT